MDSAGDLLTIKTFNRELDAHFAQQMLEENGIECYLAGVEFHQLRYHGLSASISLQIKKSDAVRAKQLLGESQSDLNDMKYSFWGGFIFSPFVIAIIVYFAFFIVSLFL